jgi:plasmid stabilization system protein ParE
MPQESWSQKDERMYESIKDSAKESGKSEARAKEMAARTVNKRRQDEGRTAKKTYGGTGNPNASLDDRTVAQLRNRAAELDIAGRSGMTKAELVAAIRKRQ